MRRDVYNLVTVTDGKSDSAAIVKVLSEMAAGRLKSDIRLLNYYDEVPVCYPSSITTVENDSVELAVHEHQALVIKHDNSTLIKSRHFHNELGVHCYAAYASIPKKLIILHNFAYAQIRAERREAVRVKVYGTTKVTFSYENSTIEGDMIDISGNGISIHSDLVPATKPNQSGYLNFTLAGAQLAVSGSFVRSTQTENDLHICMFQMKPDRNSETIIGRYIYQRQVEIVQLLKEGLAEE